jgi:hypothetical protein
MAHKDPAARAEYFANRYTQNRQAEIDRVAAWRKANPEKARAQYSRIQKRRKVRLGLEALEQAKATAKPSKPSPQVQRLLDLAKAKSQGIRYGYQGGLNAERR